MHNFNFCPKCGGHLDGDELFCPACGFNLDISGQSNPQSPSSTLPSQPPVPPTQEETPTHPHQPKTELRADLPKPDSKPEPKPEPKSEPKSEHTPKLVSTNVTPEPESLSKPQSKSAPASPQHPVIEDLPYEKTPLGYDEEFYQEYLRSEANAVEGNVFDTTGDSIPQPKEKSGKRKLWILIGACAVAVIIGVVCIFSFNSEEKKAAAVIAEKGEGIELLHSPSGTPYLFPTDVTRLGLNGNVRLLVETYEFSPEDKIQNRFNFDHEGFLTSTSGEGIGVPNNWDFSTVSKTVAKYNRGMIVSSGASKDGQDYRWEYKYIPKDETHVEVMRVLNDGTTELAMELIFDDKGQLTKRVEQPGNDTYIYNDKGVQSFSSDNLPKEQILETDDQGNWTLKQVDDYKIRRSITYF